MADDDKKTGLGEKAGALAGKLTAYPDSEIFKQDNERYYQKGKTFRELDGIRDNKLVEGLEALKDNKAPSVEAKAALKEAAKLLVNAEKALKTKSTEVAEIPLARLIEAANQYYTVGDNKSGDTLINYAIQQSEAIDKENKVKGEGAITKQLKEFKDAVDEHYKGVKAPRVSVDPKMEALLAAAGKTTLSEPNPKDSLPPAAIAGRSII